MTNLARLQLRLAELEYGGIIVPSTDEYLSEYVHPSARRLEWATGFRGSTGLALVVPKAAALFVDGRYTEQAKRDTRGTGIQVLSLDEPSRNKWLTTYLRGCRLALDTRMQSYIDVERILTVAAAHNIHIVPIERNVIDDLWRDDRPPGERGTVIDYPTSFAGAPALEKCNELRGWLSSNDFDCYLMADPEEVAWLLNVRTDEENDAIDKHWHIVPRPTSRALVEAQGAVLWFVDRAKLEPALLARLNGAVEITDPMEFERNLEERLRGKRVAANLRRTPYRYGAIAARVGTLRDEVAISRRRWRKHANEIQRAREGHYLDGQAVIRFLAWLARAVKESTVTEIDAARKLTELRRQLAGYRGISMPVHSASGPNGALAHYTPSEETNRKINDHPIYWMDSGGQYFGCSTDNTVCLAVGTPEPRQIRAHTLVVKGFIAMALARFPVGIYSTQLDTLARQYLWQEGLDYGHGTGHGVGNFMNIHEGPYIRKEPHHPLVAPMEAGMIVSNEPGYYAAGDFGVRIESHLLVVQAKSDGFLEFETISRLPIDPALVDAALLTAGEKRWLADYHAWIANGYKGCFDQQTACWLGRIADFYASVAA